MSDMLKRLVNRLKRVEREKVSWCQAVVTDNDPLTIKLKGSDTEVRVQGIDGLGYDVNDVVTVLVRDADMLALGASTGSPGGSVTYTAGDGLDLSSGIFSVDLKSGGGLKIESTELAADFGTTSGKVAEGSALAAKADLASPAFTGNPTAPTQSAGNNSTRVATTAYADGAVATASTADRNRANHTGTQAQSTVTNLTTDLAAKAPLESPVFTGSPTAPTPSAGDSDTSLATTAFVAAAVQVAQAGLTIKSIVLTATVSALAANTRTGNVLTANANGELSATGIDNEVTQVELENDTRGILVKNEPTGAKNGIYEITHAGSAVTPWVLTRRDDANTSESLPSGSFVSVLDGETYRGASFYLATSDPITLNTTSLDWQLYSFLPTDHDTSHLPSGTDALATAAPVAVGTANAEGTADSFARSDHVHAPLVLEGTQKDCGADMTVGTSYADVNNLTYTVGATGTYLVTFNLDVLCTTTGGTFIASLDVNGSGIRNAVLGGASSAANQNRTPVSLSRRVAITAGQTVKVSAIRFGGGYTIEADSSSMTVQRVA